MPQMSPLWWVMLFFIFSATLLVFSSLNYFMNLSQPHHTQYSSSLKHQTMNWKW